MNNESKDDSHLVAFQIGAEDYAVPVHEVESIIKNAAVTAMPGSPPYVRGIMNLRGRVTSVVDLRERFGMEPTEPTEETRILVAHVHGATLGVMVDSVSEVLTVKEEDIKAPPVEIVGQSEASISGVMHLDDRLVALIDFAAVLGDIEQEDAEAAEAAIAS